MSFNTRLSFTRLPTRPISMSWFTPIEELFQIDVHGDAIACGDIRLGLSHGLMGAPPRADEQSAQDETVEVVRASIDPVRFDAAWERGRTLSEDEAVVVAVTNP